MSKVNRGASLKPESGIFNRVSKNDDQMTVGRRKFDKDLEDKAGPNSRNLQQRILRAGKSKGLSLQLLDALMSVFASDAEASEFLSLLLESDHLSESFSDSWDAWYKTLSTEQSLKMGGEVVLLVIITRFATPAMALELEGVLLGLDSSPNGEELLRFKSILKSELIANLNSRSVVVGKDKSLLNSKDVKFIETANSNKGNVLSYMTSGKIVEVKRADVESLIPIISDTDNGSKVPLHVSASAAFAPYLYGTIVVAGSGSYDRDFETFTSWSDLGYQNLGLTPFTTLPATQGNDMNGKGVLLRPAPGSNTSSSKVDPDAETFIVSELSTDELASFSDIDVNLTELFNGNKKGTAGSFAISSKSLFSALVNIIVNKNDADVSFKFNGLFLGLRNNVDGINNDRVRKESYLSMNPMVFHDPIFGSMISDVTSLIVHVSNRLDQLDRRNLNFNGVDDLVINGLFKPTVEVLYKGYLRTCLNQLLMVKPKAVPFEKFPLLLNRSESSVVSRFELNVIEELQSVITINNELFENNSEMSEARINLSNMIAVATSDANRADSVSLPSNNLIDVDRITS